MTGKSPTEPQTFPYGRVVPDGPDPVSRKSPNERPSMPPAQESFIEHFFKMTFVFGWPVWVGLLVGLVVGAIPWIVLWYFVRNLWSSDFR